MQLYELTLKQLKSKLINQEISSSEIVDSILDRIKVVDEKVKAFITVTEDMAKNLAKDLKQNSESKVLTGIPYGLKDDMCTNGVRTTCASKMLENFTPNYDATVVSRLKDQGGVLIGKLNMDEFSMGSSTEQSAFFATRNPWDLSRVPGGSSGGSAAAVAADELPFALGSDTGGSIRQPASFCGIVGFKPTYGSISRWGVMPFASSLDQVGIFSKDVQDCATVMNVIAGKDQLDSTSVDLDSTDYISYLDTNIKGMKIGFPKEYFQKGMNEEVKALIMKALNKYEEMGAIVQEVSLPHSEYALQAYHVIASAEASTNLARLDGVEYGLRDFQADNVVDMFSNSRAKGFGDEVKLRTMFGTFVLSSGYYERYYLKAMQVRRLVNEDFNKVFQDVDVIISPTTMNTAFKIGQKADDVLSLYMNDVLTVPVNMAGLPGISIPCGFIDGLPVGMQIIGKPFADGSVLKTAFAFEQNTDYHKQKPVLGVN
ncbi:MAG TPA: Asp-tRNA(Asn)/Glu-tRNA(Gln) amidotransferase subunit GatA [Syntrophomonadaceae bacterium]|nr:Asp-tRNA(Asn)/Glu-tRNA(Gln) amidotransferase subunit GatA [Syntrophomonadaceae bacterium]